MALSTCSQFETETEFEQDLGDVVYEYLIINGFLPTSKGTRYYQKVIENIVLFLNANPNKNEINDLRVELVNPYSAFYLNTAMESGAFAATFEEHKKDTNSITRNTNSNPLGPLITFHKEIQLSAKNSNILAKRPEGSYMVLAYVDALYILNLIKNNDIKLPKVDHKRLIYLY